MEYFRRLTEKPWVKGGLTALTIMWGASNFVGCVNLGEYLRNQDIKYRAMQANGERTNTNVQEERGGPTPISQEEYERSCRTADIQDRIDLANGNYTEVLGMKLAPGEIKRGLVYGGIGVPLILPLFFGGGSTNAFPPITNVIEGVQGGAGNAGIGAATLP